MPVSLADLKKGHKSLSVPYETAAGPVEIQLDYNPSWYDGATEAKIRAGANLPYHIHESHRVALERMLIRWDVVDEAGNEIPITPEIPATLPTWDEEGKLTAPGTPRVPGSLEPFSNDFLVAIYGAILEDIRVGKRNEADSDDG